MRVSLFLGNHHRITRSADRVITIVHEGPINGDELNMYVGTNPAETAVIADRLIEALQAIRGRALRQAVELGQTEGIGAATHIRNDIAEIAERLPAPGFDDEVTSIGVVRVPVREPIKFVFADDPEGAEIFDGFDAGLQWNGFDNVFITPELRDRWIAEFSEAADLGHLVEDLKTMPLTPDGLVDTIGWTTQIVTLCGFPSSVSDATCILRAGHPADNPARFHRFSRFELVAAVPAVDGDHFAGRD